MRSSVVMLAMLWLVQVTGAAMPDPGSGAPAFARPVVARPGGVIGPDPVIGCIHRPSDSTVDEASLDRAGRKILQTIKLTRVREAERFAQLGPREDLGGRLVPSRPPSEEDRRRRRALIEAIDRHWEIFETRVYEARMFRFRPFEARQAASRAALAWDALLGLIQQAEEPLPDDLIDEFNDLDAMVGVLRASGS